MANLSSTSSIVDYLTLTGKDSSYTARKKLYGDLGLESRLGTYTGSGDQNTNLLNTLRSQASTTPTTELYGMSTPTGPRVYSPTTPTPTNPVPTTPSLDAILGQFKSTTPSTPFTPTPATPTNAPAAALQPAQPQPQPQSQPTPPAPTPATTATDTAGQQPGFNATDALSALGMGANAIPSADEALKKVMDSPAYQLYLEKIGLKTKAEQAKAETSKQSLDQQAEEKAAEINESYRRRGGYGSELRVEDLRKLSESLATSKLGVDRELALNLLENDVDVRTRIFSDVQKIIDTAISDNDKEQSEALGQLNKAGFALVGGELIPTVESRRLGETDITVNVVDDGTKKYAVGINKNTGEVLYRSEIGTSTSGRSRVQFRDLNGELTQIVYDDEGNIQEINPMGLSGASAGKAREAMAAFNSADSMLDVIENLARSVITAKEFKQIPQQYLQGNIEAITKVNPKAAVFLSSRDAFLSMLTRAAGERGVLTTQDVERISKALPSLTDTVDSMELKFETLNLLYQAIRDGTLAAYTNPVYPTGYEQPLQPESVNISDLDFSE